MTTKEKVKAISAAIINLVDFGLVVFCVAMFIKYAIDGSTENRFIFYTNISNIFVALVSIPNAIMLIISVVRGNRIYSKKFSFIKFISLAMITLTFITVLCIFSPIAGFAPMYEGVRIITHLIVPILAVCSYLFLEEKYIFPWKFTILALIPTFIYTLFYVINVVFLGTMPDIYQINTKEGLWIIAAVLENVICFGIIQGLYFLKKLTDKIN